MIPFRGNDLEQQADNLAERDGALRIQEEALARSRARLMEEKAKLSATILTAKADDLAVEEWGIGNGYGAVGRETIQAALSPEWSKAGIRQRWLGLGRDGKLLAVYRLTLHRGSVLAGLEHGSVPTSVSLEVMRRTGAKRA